MNGGAKIEALSDECFNGYRSLIHSLTGITLGDNRKSMLEGRLAKRVVQLGFASYAEYLVYLRATTAERPRFIDMVTTNETYFFRTPRVWDYVERYLPLWHQSHPKQTFRAWSAASSSGEEAHSLAILCQEFKLKHPGFTFEILGTDISGEMRDLATEGLYRGRSIESFKKLKPALFGKYMSEKTPGSFQAIGEVRSRLQFKTHNLFEAFAAKESFDLVLLRNVLIYFSPADQEKVLHQLAPALRADGVLIIGESESLTHIKTPFRSLEPLVYTAAEKLPGKAA